MKLRYYLGLSLRIYFGIILFVCPFAAFFFCLFLHLSGLSFNVSCIIFVCLFIFIGINRKGSKYRGVTKTKRKRRTRKREKKIKRKKRKRKAKIKR